MCARPKSPYCPPVHVDRILIIHQGAIGDFILSLPAIGSFRHNYSDASIEIWGHLDILELVEKRFYADTIGSINRREMAQCYNENTVLDAKLVEQFKQFDLIVIFGQRQEILLHNLKKHEIKEVYCVNTFPQGKESTHIIEYQLSQILRLGFKVSERVPKLFPSESDRKRASDLFTQNKVSDKTLRVAMHVGSGSRKKSWLPGSFAQLSEQLIKDDHTTIIVPIGPADEKMVREYFALIRSDAIIPFNNISLNELAAILHKCDLYVGNDSGITHLAAAVGIPVVALFGPTDPRVWGPRGDKVFTVYKGLECSPCSREEMRRCVYQGCMEKISVEEIYRRIKETTKITKGTEGKKINP